GVLDVIPNTQRDAEQLETYPFIIPNGIESTAPFDPPIAILPRFDRAKAQHFFGNLSRPLRRSKGHRYAKLTRGEQDGAAQRVRVRFVQSEGLAKLSFGLTFPAQLGSCFQAETAITSAISIEFGLNSVQMFGFIAARHDALD